MDKGSYIIPDEELQDIYNKLDNAAIDIEFNTKLSKTTRKKTYSVKLTYSGPDMRVLNALAAFDSDSWPTVKKLVISVVSLKNKLAENKRNP